MRSHGTYQWEACMAMNKTANKRDIIREYLLGRVSGEAELAEVEDLLFLDEDVCALAVEIEDELLDDLVFERLADDDAADLLRTLANNPDRRERLALAKALKEKTAEQSAADATVRPSFFLSLNQFFRQPLYAGGLALVVVAVMIASFFLFRAENRDELANLKDIYRKERPVEPRLTNFEYAPLSVTRGENRDDASKNALELEKTKFLKAVVDDPNAVNFHTLGVFYLTQQDYRSAIENLEKAVKLAENTSAFHNDLGSAYFELAKSTRESKLLNLGHANEAFSRAIELDPNLLEAVFNKALTLQEIPLKDRAREIWQLYLQKDPNSKWAQDARKHLEQLEQMQSGPTKTREQILEDFLAAYRANDVDALLNIHNSTKGTLKGVSPAEQLTQRFLRSRKARDAPTAKESIDALTLIGDLEKKKNADLFFADLAEFYARSDDAHIDDLLQAKAKWAEGYDLIRSDAAAAIGKFDESGRLYRRARNDIEAAMADLWSAQMLIHDARIAESYEKMTALLADAKARRHKIISANLSYWLGVCDGRQRSFSRSIKHTRSALSISQETENLFELKHAAENLAIIYNSLGEAGKSLDNLSGAFETDNVYYVDTSQTWRNLNTTADLFSQIEHYSTAVDFATESVGLSRLIFGDKVGVNDSLRHLSSSLTKNGRFAKAIEVSNAAIELALTREQNPQNRKYLADAFLTRGDVNREMGDCPAALEDYTSSLGANIDQTEQVQSRYRLHKGKLQCFYDLKHQTDFESELETVLKMSEEYRSSIRQDDSRQAFFENEQVIFDLAISNSLAHGDKERAFQFVEASRARSLLEFVRSGKTIADVEEDFASVSKPLSIKEIQDRLPDNVQLVEYQLLNDKLAIWNITKQRFDLSEKPIVLKDLEKTIGEYRRAVIAKDDPQAVRTLAAQLHTLLIPGDLEPGKILCLIPDRSLHQVPFASLLAPEGKYLIETFALSYSPSASIFILATESARLKDDRSETLLSVGNPAFDRSEHPTLKDLPEAETEARQIAAAYDQTKTFIGDRATKLNFIDNLEASEIVHFAGHFVSNERTSSYSTMLFSDDDLRVFELAGVKLPRSKLVVLSACETGFERFNRSEGAIGIARTFLALGTPVVIASSWKVDSAASRDLMISFHKKRRLEKLTTIEALRQSQLEMIRSPDFGDPFYWAAFSVFGGLTNY